jgi:hypothetical protein
MLKIRGRDLENPSKPEDVVDGRLADATQFPTLDGAGVEVGKFPGADARIPTLSATLLKQPPQRRRGSGHAQRSAAIPAILLAAPWPNILCLVWSCIADDLLYASGQLET